MKRYLVSWSTGLLFLALAAVPAWPGDPFPCDIVPFDATYENGTGAEPGVVREFVSAIPIPEECRIDGDSFLFEAGFNMTRTAGGSPSATIEIVVREPVAMEEGGNFVPGVELIPPITANIQNIPLFPNAVRHVQPLGRLLLTRDGVGMPGARWNGDLFPEIFLTVDESTGTPFVPCFTEITPTEAGPAFIPRDLCPPNWRAIGQSWVTTGSHAAFGPFSVGYSAVELTSACSNPTPLLPQVSCRISNQDKEEATAGTWDLALLEGSPTQPGLLICQFLNVTLPFDFQCALTSTQVTLYQGGTTFMEADPGGSVIQSPVVPANHLIFYDDFESGGIFFWSGSLP